MKEGLKIALLTVTLVLVAFLLISCFVRALTYGKYEFLHESESYEAMTIQIVKISEGYSDLTTVSTADLRDQMTVIATIDDKEAFMDELVRVEHNYPLGAPPFGLSSGLAIVLIYSDGTEELIAREGCALIDGETTEIRYHGWFVKDSYTEFIEKWLPRGGRVGLREE